MDNVSGATSGLTLRLERVGRDVKAKDVALASGKSAAWVSRIESRRIVSAADAQTYRAALASLPAVATSDGAEAA